MVSVSLMWPPELMTLLTRWPSGHEQPHVRCYLGDDQAEVQRGLEPAAPEDGSRVVADLCSCCWTAVGEPGFYHRRSGAKALK
jgi:hypothetical protein